MTNTQIAKLYVAVNGTAPTAAEMTTLLADANAATTIMAMNDFTGASNTATLNAAYQAAFGRDADSEGLAYWGAELTAGTVTAATLMDKLLAGADAYVSIGNDAIAALNTADKGITTNKAAIIIDAIAANLTPTQVATALSLVTATDTAAATADIATSVSSNTAVSYDLTVSTADVIESNNGNDTVTASTLTLQSGDIIVDGSTTDSDTMNIALTAATTATPTITNVENVNVNLDYFTGTGTDFVATNVTGATIAINSDKLGFNGTAGVTFAGANTIAAGSAVTTLTVAGLTSGTVDTGSAGTVSVTGTAAVANTINVNGDIKTGAGLNNVTSTFTTLNVTAASDVIYTTEATLETTITGNNDITLQMVGADLVTGASIVDSTTGTIIVKDIGATATTDTTNMAIDKFILSGTATMAATVASGQLLETSTDIATQLTIATTAATDTTATLNLGHDITTLVISDTKLDTTINNTDANVIGTLTAGVEDVTLTGSSNLTVTAGTAKSFDASAATGTLNYTLGTSTAETTISGTTTTNTVTLGHVNNVITYNGQTGIDTINTLGTAAGIIAGDLGSGNDVLNIVATLGAATIALDGGAGTDTIKILSGANTNTASTWAVSNFETIEIQAAADSVVQAKTLAMDSAQLTGTSFAITTQEAIDTAALTVTLDAASADLSGLTFDTNDTVAINGSATTSYTVVGTATADTITIGSNAAATVSTITGGAGDDVFVFATDDTASTKITSITDYQANALASDNDQLTLGVNTIVADKILNVAEVEVGTAYAFTAAQGIFSTATAAVNIVVEDGMMTLSGLSEDIALADTLDEMITLAQTAAVSAADGSFAVVAADTVAFEFAGNTYIVETKVESGAADATDDGVYDAVAVLGAVANVIELTGLTTATAMAGTAAADTIFLA